jgi:hypothetical protein
MNDHKTVVCTCDCVNCVTGNHADCYYEARYTDGIEQCPFKALSSLPYWGWFENEGDTPAFDPGLRVPCLLCGKALDMGDIRTTSLMWPQGNKSLFYRTHRSCHDAASAETISVIDEAVLNEATKSVH